MSGKLFLICPSDFLEQPICREFKSEYFFYTTLGLNFRWDDNNIGNILFLIEQNSIDDIVFVSDFRNSFYLHCTENDKNFKLRSSIPEIATTLESAAPLFYLCKNKEERLKELASNYLFERENNLKLRLDCNIRYKITSLLFDKEKAMFLKPDYIQPGCDIHFN